MILTGGLLWLTGEFSLFGFFKTILMNGLLWPVDGFLWLFFFFSFIINDINGRIALTWNLFCLFVCLYVFLFCFGNDIDGRTALTWNLFLFVCLFVCFLFLFWKRYWRTDCSDLKPVFVCLYVFCFVLETILTDGLLWPETCFCLFVCLYVFCFVLEAILTDGLLWPVGGFLQCFSSFYTTLANEPVSVTVYFNRYWRTGCCDR